MKHTVQITLLLIALFLAAQLIGLVVINHYLPEDLPVGIEKPDASSSMSIVSLILGIVIATIAAFLIFKYRAMRLWKAWFFLGVLLTLTISFGVIMPDIIALIVGALFAFWKVFKPNVYVHNFTELFIYGGLAAIFVPVLNIWAISIIIVIVAIYDMIAVWKTKHMVKLAKMQAESKVFAGLLIQYPAKPISKKITRKKVKVKRKKTEIIHSAILGGGDIGIPLLFSGVILMAYGWVPALISVLFTTVAIGSLFFLAEKKKFYPAIPFIAVGCFLSLLPICLAF